MRHWFEHNGERRDHAVETEAGDERGGLAVPMREAHAQPLALAAAAMAAGHVRRAPGLVDEDEPLGIEVRLCLEPRATLVQDIRAILFDRVAGLFFRVIPCRWKKRDRAEVDVAMPRPASRSRNSSSV